MSTRHVYNYLKYEVDQLRIALRLARKEIERFKVKQNGRLLRQVETEDGVNVIIDERWAAFFPKESTEQVRFLVENTNRALSNRNDPT